ncbi:putative 1-acylglycerol-3-phosphate O-acyltransferase [Helianthus annuus]|uniref:1-acylglycerol-3-phosphate O-acyltransferase n=1 Tax=Helianthus annuus TaxID=4232 RepID=A0A9K3H6M0_HELAN|nr:putative 1-acylglycerol-3-phosphate O-acyltransferase [Helianthus annuus]KAJ0453334.1 putative 1-acylglycerol-3-phosphate O-acyltransferase [Helianthus annuus]KAJ0458525.1 putative 1-acylglycerol-3-phosphate O-acyltransferase [Helianthus annuus]KAJ0475256.1 putative 1-acylglycerol-3-phosphate O-acyltransferase [Helianthus annuus]KAJ0650812.1 putative 1-acylglycerol-3-phosphate O-acyltransferase [Helianthus annuus]
MEVTSNEPEETRVLTPLRFLRGVFCLLVLLSTAFVILVYCGFITAVIFRLFSVHYSRKATAFFFGSWLALWPLLFEKINKTKVIFSGETVPATRVIPLTRYTT